AAVAALAGPVAVRSPSAAARPVRPAASATAAAVATVAAHALFTCPGTCPPGVSAESSDIRPAVVACAGAHPPADAVCRATILALKSRADLSGSRRSTATALPQLRYRTEGLAGSGGLRRHRVRWPSGVLVRGRCQCRGLPSILLRRSGVDVPFRLHGRWCVVRLGEVEHGTGGAARATAEAVQGALRGAGRRPAAGGGVQRVRHRPGVRLVR